MDLILAGNAVVPKDQPDHHLLTVYDFERNYDVALCNWVVGTRMFKRRCRVDKLVKVDRRTRLGRD